MNKSRPTGRFLIAKIEKIGGNNMVLLENVRLQHERRKNRDKIEVQKECTVCHKTISVFLTQQEYDNLQRYLEGEGHIQDMLPNVSRAERELLAVSGICGKCWREMFGPAPWERVSLFRR